VLLLLELKCVSFLNGIYEMFLDLRRKENVRYYASSAKEGAPSEARFSRP
jgi:hypothetical protein